MSSACAFTRPCRRFSSMKPTGECFDSAWRARSEVVAARISECDVFLRQHYLGKRPGVVVASFLLKIDSCPRGCIVFALPPKQTFVRYGGLTWELARLFIDDGVPQNAETFLIGRAVRVIKKTRPDVVALVSYADPSRGHSGKIYVASNWTRDGKTDSERKTPRFDYEVNGKVYSRRSHVPEGADIRRVPRVSKHRFFMPLRDQRLV